LHDFIGCIDEILSESEDKGLVSFDFKEWCLQWLYTPGLNILEPIVEYNEDNSVKTLAIKQTMSTCNGNILRKQAIDIALYDDEFEPHIIENITLSDQ